MKQSIIKVMIVATAMFATVIAATSCGEDKMDVTTKDTTVSKETYLVRDDKGNPIADATLKASTGAEVKTAADGTATLSFPANDQVIIIVSAAGYLDAYATGTSITLNKGGASLTGIVTFEALNGSISPANAVEVVFTLDGGAYVQTAYKATTDANGKYTITGLPEGKSGNFATFLKKGSNAVYFSGSTYVSNTGSSVPIFKALQYTEFTTDEDLILVGFTSTVKDNAALTLTFNHAITSNSLNVYGAPSPNLTWSTDKKVATFTPSPDWGGVDNVFDIRGNVWDEDGDSYYVNVQVTVIP
ncbi:hypothetical protein FACS1894199_15980 [Bacteroidia bacterium]|nr:hypothetical protein FACS1894199_15980 [Bacteroidia bacterium]